MAGLGLQADGPGPWRVDLRQVIAEQARGLGIGEVTLSGRCTRCDQGHFFSHRASAGRDGRQVAYLGQLP